MNKQREKVLKIDMLSDYGIEEEVASNTVSGIKPVKIPVAVERKGMFAFDEEEHFYTEISGKKMPDMRQFVEDYRKKEGFENPLIILVDYPFSYAPSCDYTRVGPRKKGEYEFSLFRDDENRALVLGGSGKKHESNKMNGFVVGRYLDALSENDPGVMANNQYPMFLEYKKNGYMENKTPPVINKNTEIFQKLNQKINEMEIKTGKVPGLNSPGYDSAMGK